VKGTRVVSALRVVTTVALVVCATIAFAACTASHDDGQFVGEAKYQARYREVVKSFPEKMPPGATFPPSAPPLDRGTVTHVANADAQAYFTWRCAWEDIYLSPSTPTERAEAMRELRRWPQTSWARKWLDDSGGMWAGILDAAELGDSSELSEFHRTDCS
jgi:hypothetical protein